MRRLWTLLPCALLLGCGGQGAAPTPAPPPGGGIGNKAADVVNDEQVLKEAQGVANEVVRNAQDCDFVKGALPGVNQKLDEVSHRVRTGTGETTLAAIRSRISSIAQSCP